MSYTSFMVLQSIGTPNDNIPSKRQLMEQSLLQRILRPSKSWICALRFDSLAYLSRERRYCLVTMNLSLPVPHFQILASQSDTMPFSYHRVREAIAAKIMNFVFKKGHENPADILSKHCAYPQLWPHVQPLLFWVGNPSCPNDNKKDPIREEKIEIKFMMVNKIVHNPYDTAGSDKE